MEAHDFCEKLNINGYKFSLVSVNDEEEMDYIREHLSFISDSGNSWLGLKKKPNQLWSDVGNITWLDGLPLSRYENWADGEPDDGGVHI